MTWMCVAVLLLWTSRGRCTAAANTSNLIEYTAEGFSEKLSSGKTFFVYFGHQVSPTISLFLVQLEKSAEALHDYGISVAKVNCSREPVAKFCPGEKLMKKAYLFRSGEVLKGFDVGTVFDVNAIVSHTLFAILFEEVRYVQSDADLQALERTARGKTDMVLGYVQMLGTQEHRSLMEAVFVYGAKYQFILTTGGPILENLGVSPSSRSSGVWFLHCRLLQGSRTSERCPVTPMSKVLSTLHLYSFLQLMEAPLVSEVYDDPSSIPPPPSSHLQTPQLFLFSRPATEHLDLDTARALAWRLRGLALLLLVHRESPAVKTPEEYNAAYRLPGPGSEVKYLTLTNLDEVVDLFANRERENEEEEEEEDKVTREERKRERECVCLPPDVLDDEIGESVYRNRGLSLDMDAVAQLTSHSFHAAVTQSSHTVVLFYLKWDAVSMAFLSSFIEVAERLADSEVADVQMCVVDCGEWTDLCATQPISSHLAPFQPITAFPSVLLLRPQDSSQRYSGMLGSDALHRFIMLSRPASPVLLSTQEEVTSFLQEVPLSDLIPDLPDRVLGLFKTHTHSAVPVFTEAAKSLRGEVLSGLLTDRLAERWAADHSVDLPVVLVFPSWRTHPSPLPLSSSAEDLITHINTALLHTLPELTVENLPSFLSPGKAVLLLFVGEAEDERGRRENEAAVEEMRGVAERGGRRTEEYLVCWIHLGRTPAGISVLEWYLGSLPPLPALLLTHLPSGGQIYHYPPNTPVVLRSVLHWLQRIEDGAEPPAGTMGEDHWAPVVPFYDFLSVMDQEAPGYAQQRTPKSKEKKKSKEEEEDEERRRRRRKKRDSSPSTPPLHSEL
ncbi:thioredoxin domain-containing protein 16 [Diretmus argenteus]